MESTIRAETEIARRNMPDIAWPTILLAAGLLAGFALSCWGGLTGRLPLWLAAAINAVILYALYTPLHEAIRPVLEGHGARIEGFWPQTPGHSA